VRSGVAARDDEGVNEEGPMPNCRSGLAGTFDLVARLSARDIVEVDMLMTDSTQVTALVTKRKDEIRLVLTEQ
jgi:hypothetical protein